MMFKTLTTRIQLFIALGLLTCLSLSSFTSAAGKDFYQMKIYHLKNQEQEKRVDAFLEHSYLPALHRLGIKSIGVFKPITKPGEQPAERLIYVLIPFSSDRDFLKLEHSLAKDLKFQSDGKDYLNGLFNDPPYERLESVLLSAFDKHPKLTLPQLSTPKSERVYELRSYEGHTERISKNKIDMFNTGDEIGLFKRLGFNAVFYGEVISGSRMPNLMYLTTFNNKADRDAHWDAFRTDAQWKTLSKLPQYQNNVSRNEMKFLYPADYSDY